MPEEYFESTHFKLPALTGKNPIHDIGTGFKKLAEKIDEVLYGRAVLLEGGANSPNFLSWAAIGASGAIENSSGDFTVTNPEMGLYKVTFKTAKTSARYLALATVNGLTDNRVASLVAQKTEYFEIATTNAATAEKIQVAFSVLVIAAS
jgi:hypothetical protein